jgi:hypothetical protein
MMWVIPYVLYGGFIDLDVDWLLFGGGLCPPLYTLGDRVIWNPRPILALKSYPSTIWVVSFCTD